MSESILPSDETGLALEATMRVSSELSRAFHVRATQLFTDKSEGGYLLRSVLRATFGTSNRNKLLAMSAATFLRHYKDFDSNLYEAKLARAAGRKPDWRGTKHDEEPDVF
jgi:hypothetical protein